MRECRYCGRKKALVCMNTREMADTSDKTCYAALMFAGGGEYTHEQHQSAELFRRARCSSADTAAPTSI